jgi:hypothetical protein
VTGHAPNRADRLLIRPASGRQAGTGLSTRTHHSQDTRGRGHPLTESRAKSTDTNLTNAPDGTRTHSQSSHARASRPRQRASATPRSVVHTANASRVRWAQARLHMLHLASVRCNVDDGSCSTFQSCAVRFSLSSRTFNPKVAGSIPARPIRERPVKRALVVSVQVPSFAQASRGIGSPRVLALRTSVR